LGRAAPRVAGGYSPNAPDRLPGSPEPKIPQRVPAEVLRRRRVRGAGDPAHVRAPVQADPDHGSRADLPGARRSAGRRGGGELGGRADRELEAAGGRGRPALLPPYEAAAIVRSAVLSRDARLADAMSALGGNLSASTMRRLN